MIPAVMGLKLPMPMWECLTNLAQERGVRASAIIQEATLPLLENPEDTIRAAMDSAIRHKPHWVDGPRKGTSFSLDTESIQTLQEYAERLEMPREALVRILLRQYLSDNCSGCGAATLDTLSA